MINTMTPRRRMTRREPCSCAANQPAAKRPKPEVASVPLKPYGEYLTLYRAAEQHEDVAPHGYCTRVSEEPNDNQHHVADA